MAAWVYHPLAWGINLLHFAFAPLTIVYAIAGSAAIMLAIASANKDTAALVPLDKKPWALLAAIIILLLVALWQFRVTAPLLGDGFTFINNFRDSFAGRHRLILSRGPLALGYFYAFFSLFGSMEFPAMMDAILVGEMLLAVILTIGLFTIIRRTIPDARRHLSILLLLLGQVYIQVFFGYPEVYAPTMTALAAALVAVMLYFRGRIPFVAVALVAGLLACVHLQAVICLPAFVYLIWHEYQTSGWKQIVPAALLYLVAGASVFIFRGDLVERFFNITDTHILPLVAPAHHEYFVYPLFSPRHGSELLNLCVLQFPSVLLLTLGLVQTGKKGIPESPFLRFLLLASAGGIMFLLLARFDLGLARDWDTTTPAFFIFSFTGVLLLYHNASDRHPGLLTLLLIGSLIHTAPFIALNASRQPAIARAESLIDTSVVPPGGIYLASYSHASYFAAVGDSSRAEASWSRLAELEPNDERAYRHLSELYLANPHADSLRTKFVIDRWLTLEPANPAAHTAQELFQRKFPQPRIASGAKNGNTME